MTEKCIVTCALTGVFTDPARFAVPVTPEEMAQAALDAHNAGASIVHCHFRRQEPGLGHLPTWDTDIVGTIVDAIRAAVPGLIINLSTGVMTDDISEPVACLRRTKPEMAALNAGSLNYLRMRKDDQWAWPPVVFANSVDKIKGFADVMAEENILPECECFDTGIVRSIGMFVRAGMVPKRPHISLVMGVASGMPAKPEWLPLLLDELPEGAHWQVIGIGRQEVWDLHRRCAELGGNVRTGVEDTFYLPDGSRTSGNGPLIEAASTMIRETGREVATLSEARSMLGLPAA
jgi:3-keto-5-aminohexanoate cleavage enzyme